MTISLPPEIVREILNRVTDLSSLGILYQTCREFDFRLVQSLTSPNFITLPQATMKKFPLLKYIDHNIGIVIDSKVDLPLLNHVHLIVPENLLEKVLAKITNSHPQYIKISVKIDYWILGIIIKDSRYIIISNQADYPLNRIRNILGRKFLTGAEIKCQPKGYGANNPVLMKQPLRTFLHTADWGTLTDGARLLATGGIITPYIYINLILIYCNYHKLLNRGIVYPDDHLLKYGENISLTWPIPITTLYNVLEDNRLLRPTLSDIASYQFSYCLTWRQLDSVRNSVSRALLGIN